MIPSLCEFCELMSAIVSGKGSRFLMCQKSVADKRFPKYPPQPIIQCDGFDRKNDENGST